MRAFGLTSRHQRDCCPGHSDFPRDTYRNRRSKRAHRRDTKLYRRRERRILRHQLNMAVRKGEF